MALSGTDYVNVDAGWRLQSEWTATQDISANTSTITVKLYWMSLGSSYTVNSSATKSGQITIDGTSSSFSGAGLAALNGNEKKLLYTYTKTVTHNADGTKSVPLSSYFDANVTLNGTYYGRITVNGTAYLDTIPRASTLSSSPSWTAGNDLPISISRASTSFTHTVKIYVNNTLIKTITGIGTSTTATFSTSENTTIFTQLAQTSSKQSKITLETYNGGSLVGSNDYLGTCSAPSASTITTSADFNIGDPVSVSISRSNSAFTHTLKFYTGNTLISTITGVGTSATWTPSQAEKDSMYNTTPNSNTVSSKIECYTYYNGVQVQSLTSNTGTATVTNSNPTFGTGFTYRDTNTTTTTITGNDQYIIQNQSTVLVEIPTSAKATAVNGATMVSYVATLNGVSITQPYSSSSIVSFNFGTINANTNLTLSVKAVDSRGNSTTTTKTVTIVPYSSPSLTVTATRANNFDNQTTLQVSGSFSLLNVAGQNKNSIQTFQYRYKDSTSGTWGAWTDLTYTTNGSTYTANNVVLTLDNTKAWNIDVQIIDKLSTTTSSKTVPVGQPILFIDSAKKSVSVNKFPANNSSFEVNGLTEITNGAQTLNLKAGQSANHVYMAFYADSTAQTTRSGYFGYPSSGATYLKVANEMTNGNIELEPNGTGTVIVKGSGLTVNKNGNYSSIIFPAQSSDPGYIKHYENNNTGIMYFSVSDDIVDTDYFSFGAAPSGSFVEGARITASGKATFTALTLNGATFSKIQFGTAMVTYNASTRLKADLTFPSAFSSTPRVVTIVRWTSGSTSLDKMDLQYVENVTTTGFTVQITNKYGQSFVSSDYINIDWIAIA